jgi:hypothetical protein
MQIERFRARLGEEGLKQRFKVTMAAVHMGAVQPQELERIIVDTTVQEKFIVHSVYEDAVWVGRLENRDARRKPVFPKAQRLGIPLCQTSCRLVI